MDPSSHEQETADFIQEWAEKADKEFSDDIHIRTALVGSFEALKCINLNDTHNLQYLLNTMAFDREAAYKFDDKIDTDPQRQLVYGLHGSIEKAMRSTMVGSSEDVARPREDLVRPRENVVRPKEDLVIPAREETAQETQEPEPIPMEENIPREATPVMVNVKDKVKLEFEEENLILEDYLAQQEPNYFADNGSMVGLPRSALSTDTKGKVKFSRLRGVKRERDRSPFGTPRNRSTIIKTLKCRICSADNMNIYGFVNHLRNEHQTTPGQEKIAFKCGCGYIGNSSAVVYQHQNKCHSFVLTVIDKPETAPETPGSEPVPMERDKTSSAMLNVDKNLNDNVAQNPPNYQTDNGSMGGMSLLSTQSTGSNGKVELLGHDGGAENERDEGAPPPKKRQSKGIKTLKCRLCSEDNMSPSEFVLHLRDNHKTTPGQEKIAFKCDCGFLANNSATISQHSKLCRSVISVVDRPIGGLAKARGDVVIPAQEETAQETQESVPIPMEGDMPHEATDVMLNVDKNLDDNVVQNPPNSQTGNVSIDGMPLLSTQSTGSKGEVDLLGHGVGGAENELEEGTTPSKRRSRTQGVTTLKCRLCPADNMNITGFVIHLRNIHKTTPGQERIAFKCGCGFVAYNYMVTYQHSRQCRSVLSVVDKPIPLGGKRKRAPARSKVDVVITAIKDTAQETQGSEPIPAEGDKTSSVMLKAKKILDDNVAQNQQKIAFQCKCGFLAHNYLEVYQHSTKCRPVRSVVDKPIGDLARPREDVVIPSKRETAQETQANPSRDVDAAGDTVVMRLPPPSRPRSLDIRTLACRLCSEDTMHIGGFMNHLRNEHETTPAQEEIAFKCNCGYISCSYLAMHRHAEKCPSPSFSVVDSPRKEKT